jgi:peptide/nickel transport system permease protein
VAELVADRLWVSLPLAVLSLILSTVIAFPVGLLAAANRGRAADYGIMGGTQLGIAIPNFWFGMLLVLVFAVNLRWFSAGGFPGWEEPLLALKSLLLPSVALALPQAAILARVMRSALIETLAQDYMRTARAKGLSRRQALLRHALRNALIPVLTIIGLQFSFLLAGAIIIENVFFLPGLGRLIFQGITQRDLVVVESVTMLLVFAVIVVTFAVDIAYAAADPRLRRRA